MVLFKFNLQTKSFFTAFTKHCDDNAEYNILRNRNRNNSVSHHFISLPEITNNQQHFYYRNVYKLIKTQNLCKCCQYCHKCCNLFRNNIFNMFRSQFSISCFTTIKVSLTMVLFSYIVQLIQRILRSFNFTINFNFKAD